MAAPKLHEYTFDVKLAAVVRIKAPSEKVARGKLVVAVDLLPLVGADDMTITEIVIDDEGGPLLTELDGEELY